jgi:fluoride ion exporter CrcB/FEX
MPSTSIFFGCLLILLGVGGYVYGTMNGNASLTALIPAIFGVLLIVFGALARSMENLRKHLMHGAVLVGLLGFLATVSSFFKIPALLAGTAERPAAVVSQLAMAIICLTFVILCVKSFIDARRNRITEAN